MYSVKQLKPTFRSYLPPVQVGRVSSSPITTPAATPPYLPNVGG